MTTQPAYLVLQLHCVLCACRGKACRGFPTASESRRMVWAFDLPDDSLRLPVITCLGIYRQVVSEWIESSCDGGNSATLERNMTKGVLFFK